MRLSRLEVRNFRSIQDQTEEGSIQFGDLQCLVGPNNAGKSNLLKCIKFLVRGERPDDADHYGRDPDCEIDVRGYFEVEEEDFRRLKLGEKREAFQDEILEDGTLGICSRSSASDLELMGYYPVEERLDPDEYLAFRDRAWEEKEGGADFRDTMMDAYPELVHFLTDGKETNKGEWEKAYDRMRSERPDGIDFELRPGPLPTGISADVKNFLPEVLVVPAVKEVSEATKTTRTGELGSLLDAVSEEIREELDEAIEEALAEVSRQLNVVVDETEDEVIDERHETVKTLETRISDYVGETFPDHSISLEFPNPESSVMFDNARVWVKEEGHEKVLADDVGEGVKRILVFSLIRTLADLRQGELAVGGEVTAEEAPRKPILLLYEEAELFLHPGLQRILLDTLTTLSSSGDQVVYSTHAPFMIPDMSTGGVALVRKSMTAGTQVQEITHQFQQVDTHHQSRLQQAQNLASFIFSNRVLLVEGPSDRIVLEKIAAALDEGWDFQTEGIRILPTLGKDNLPIFRSFLTEIGVDVFVAADLDAVENVVSRLDLSEESEDRREEFLSVVQDVAEEIAEETQVNREHVHDHVRRLDWEGVIERVEQLHDELHEGQDPDGEGLAALGRILDVRGASARRQALESEETRAADARVALQAALLDDNVLLMVPQLESYYPYPGGRKTTAALEFDATEIEPAALRELMTELPDRGAGDLEVFLQRVFNG
jgi:predicted ATP-dependent endonuclease of OLD family